MDISSIFQMLGNNGSNADMSKILSSAMQGGESNNPIMSILPQLMQQMNSNQSRPQQQSQQPRQSQQDQSQSQAQAQFVNDKDVNFTLHNLYNNKDNDNNV
ncbi:MAG: hypothetical protein RSB10_03145 [Clostridia bacterium]